MTGASSPSIHFTASIFINQKGTSTMANHPKRQRRLKPKHRRTYAPTPGYEYSELRARRIRKARRCLIALTVALIAIGAALCIFR